MAYFLYKIKASKAENALPLEQYSPFESHEPASNPATPQPPSAKEKRDYRRKLVLCLFMPYLLASIDLTIVATAVPYMASHFGTSQLHHHHLGRNANSRQTRRAQLDHNSLHPNLHHLHPIIRPTRGHLRPTCRPPTRHLSHAAWKYLMCSSTNLGDASFRPRPARHELSGLDEHGDDNPSR